MSSKLEINIRSLISHCEEMANDNNKDWRLKKYIKSLDTMILEFQEEEFVFIFSKTLKTTVSLIFNFFFFRDPEPQVVEEYKNRCFGLKTVTNYIEGPVMERKIKSKIKETGVGDSIVREINQIHNSKYHNELRNELLGKDELNSNLRKRKTTEGEQEMGEAVKYYGDLQERIADDMLSLTRNLKEQTENANRIIKKDTEIVTKSTKLSDKNYASLNSEAEKLQDQSKRAWKCWMWIMILIVMTIFVFMVMFMKIMKKKI